MFDQKPLPRPTLNFLLLAVKYKSVYYSFHNKDQYINDRSSLGEVLNGFDQDLCIEYQRTKLYFCLISVLYRKLE